MSTDQPGPAELWDRAGGDPDRYRQLMREAGHLLYPGDPGYDEAPANLPCGWPGRPDPGAVVICPNCQTGDHCIGVIQDCGCQCRTWKETASA